MFQSVKSFALYYRKVIIFSLVGAGFIIASGIGVMLAGGLSQGDKNPIREIVKNSLVGFNRSDLSSGKCQGQDKPRLGRSPMNPQDFGFIIPYGSVVGGHVTPIDHQYFSPADPNSPLDAYPVFAMADAKLVEVQPRTFSTGAKKVEYRMVFAMSCKLYYYYDLVTSLTGRVKEAYEANGRGINLDVKEGEQIGYIGSQTLDFAVWDMDVNLPGFINPASYDRAEPWKIHTADPLLYYSEKLKEFLISRYVRTVEPISGKIDYDVDGRLVGNWFAEDTNGYGGPAGESSDGYWRGHLSLAPNHWDPTSFIISLGDFGGKEAQFAAKGNAPRPEEVSVESGLVKFDLVTFVYTKADGSPWDLRSLIKGPKLKAGTQVEGCLLAKLLKDRQLQAESFPKKTCSQLNSFTQAAKFYER